MELLRIKQHLWQRQNIQEEIFLYLTLLSYQTCALKAGTGTDSINSIIMLSAE